MWTPTSEQRDLRQQLIESVQTVNLLDEGFRKQYEAICHRKPKGVAKVTAARKLEVRLYSTPATKACRWEPRQDVAAKCWLSRDRPYREQPPVTLTGPCGALGSPIRGSPGAASQVVTLNERSRIQH